MVAFAGGALLVSALLELISPALEKKAIPLTLVSVFAGALLFAILDYLVKEKWDLKVVVDCLQQ